MRVIAVPVKPFDAAKTRLATELSPIERGVLSLAMLEDVLDAALQASGWATWVISADEAALEVAARRGADPMLEEAPEPTLTGAVAQAEERALGEGVDALAVVLADLPRLTADALASALWTPGPVVVAPSHSDGGTNVLLRRPPNAIRARFGTRSFDRHLHEAEEAGVPAAVVRDPGLAFDLDRPEDVVALMDSAASGWTASACRELRLAARLRVPAR